MVTTLQDLKKQSTGTKISQLKPKDQVKALLEQNRGLIKQALPKHINADRLLRVAQTSVTTTPGLLECYVPSLIGGIIQCSQMGLEPNTVLGHAYLIPFYNTKKRRKDAQVIIGYKGYIDLARRSGQIVSIAAHAVYENDFFEFEYGLNEKLSHKPLLGDRGHIIAFYAVAHLKGGGYCFEVMSRAQIEAVRDKNSKGNLVWVDALEEMGRKTLIRRLSKYLPLSVEFATASAMDDAAEKGGDQNLESSFDGEYMVLPEDTPNINEITANQTTQGETKKETKTDRFGEVFDPAKHATSAAGTPALKADGSFRIRRRTRGAGTVERNKAEETDLPDPIQKGAARITQGDVLTSIRNATNQDELDLAGDLINELEEAHKELPMEEYQKRYQQFDGGQ